MNHRSGQEAGGKLGRRGLALKAAIGLLLLVAAFGVQRSQGRATDWQRRVPDSGPSYLDPIALKLSPHGKRLYVVCEGNDELLVVSTRTRHVVGRVKVGHRPEGIAVSPDGKTLYVSNEWSDSVTVIDAASLRVLRTLKTGWGPVGVTTDAAGKFLFTANTLGNDVSVIDLATGREIKRLTAGHFPEYIARSRNGRWIYVANLLERVAPPRVTPSAQLTVIDAKRQVVANRIMIPGAIQLRRIAQAPARDGGYLLIPFLQPHNLIPLVQLQQGWYVAHGMAVIRMSASGRGKARVMEVLLDDIDHAYADGFGAACAPNGRLALVTASGANVVSVIDMAKLDRLIAHMPRNDPEALADRLDSARRFVLRRVPTGRNPTAVVISPDSSTAYIANRTDDTLTVVNLRQLGKTSTISLGGPKVITPRRRGQQLFFDARFCYQGQLACATCHPHEGFEDGLIWSLETPELGRDITENRTLLQIAGTSPFKWNGLNPNLATQDGPRTAMYIFRSQGFSQTEVQDLVRFIRSLKLPPNPHRGPSGRLNARQRLGRAIFFRTKTNAGKIIPYRDRCYYCHAPLTHYTSRVKENVGTGTRYDTDKEFDVPQLQGVYMRAPYLHNGEALTLEQIWTKYNPKDEHGYTSDMNKVQLNDLIEFLKTL